MSAYATIRNALVANGYAWESACRIARRLARRKGDSIVHLNDYLRS
jgi:hypothetical protein